MDQAPAPDGLPPSLRFLKWLVILLTLTMIAGVITVVGVLVTRMPQAFQPSAPRLPEHIALPEGTTARAVTFGTGWIAVVTEADHILILDAKGRIVQDIAITLAP